MPSSSPLFSLPPAAAAALTALLGFALSGELTYAQQNALGNLLMLVGQVLETMSAQGQLQESAVPSSESRLDRIEQELLALQKRLDRLSSQPQGDGM